MGTAGSDSLGSSTSPASQSSQTRRAALKGLLLSMFKTDDFEQFLRSGPRWERLPQDLPSPLVEPSKYFGAAVDVLDQRGLLTADFFAALFEVRSHKSAQIKEVAARFEETVPPAEPPPEPTGELTPEVQALQAHLRQEAESLKATLTQQLQARDAVVDALWRGWRAASEGRSLRNVPSEPVSAETVAQALIASEDAGALLRSFQAARVLLKGSPTEQDFLIKAVFLPLLPHTGAWSDSKVHVLGQDGQRVNVLELSHGNGAIIEAVLAAADQRCCLFRKLDGKNEVGGRDMRLLPAATRSPLYPRPDTVYDHVVTVLADALGVDRGQLKGRLRAEAEHFDPDERRKHYFVALDEGGSLEEVWRAVCETQSPGATATRLPFVRFVRLSTEGDDPEAYEASIIYDLVKDHIG